MNNDHRMHRSRPRRSKLLQEVEPGRGSRSLPARASRPEGSDHRGARTYMAAVGADLRISGCRAKAQAEYIAVLQSKRERMESGVGTEGGARAVARQWALRGGTG